MKDALGAIQSVLVLGAGSDIGGATARRLAGDGRLRLAVLAARHPEALDGLVGELRAAGVEDVEVVPFDADEPDAHAALFDDLAARHRDLDLVLVAFGVLGDPAVTRDDPDAALALFRTNVTGALSVVLRAANLLAAQGHGALVVLSSVAGERVRKSNFVYGASKAAIDGLAQGLGDHLHGSGVDVMVVRPGFVHTKMTAGLRAPPLSTTADAVADAIVDGLRRGARVVWVPAALRWVMAVARHLPRAVFRRLDF
jgi:decaprenylphospho-beta-D-erythro-pentofuranosid-2-ulose 2-reductase